MEADDPLLMEMQAEDLWCEAYNMRTGSRGIFPTFYAVKVTKDNQPKGTKCFSKCRVDMISYYNFVRSSQITPLFIFFPEVKSDWLDTFWVKFMGSVQVPYHKGNDVLCAAMQKVW